MRTAAAHTSSCPASCRVNALGHSSPCLSTQILGISVDSQFSHLAWIQTGPQPATDGPAVPGLWGLDVLHAAIVIKAAVIRPLCLHAYHTST